VTRIEVLGCIRVEGSSVLSVSLVEGKDGIKNFY